MGSSHKSNKTIQSIPKRQEFIPGTTDTFDEKVFDPRDTLQLNSPLNFNLFPDTPLAILDVFSSFGHPILFQVTSSIIEISQPVSKSSLTMWPFILVLTNFRSPTCLTSSFDNTTFTLDLNFFLCLFCLVQHWEARCPTKPHLAQGWSLKGQFFLKCEPAQLQHSKLFPLFLRKVFCFTTWTWDVTFPSILVVSLFTFINFWHSSVTFCKFISRSCSIIDKILDLKSLSLGAVSPWTNM